MVPLAITSHAFTFSHIRPFNCGHQIVQSTKLQLTDYTWGVSDILWQTGADLVAYVAGLFISCFEADGSAQFAPFSVKQFSVHTVQRASPDHQQSGLPKRAGTQLPHSLPAFIHAQYVHRPLEEAAVV